LVKRKKNALALSVEDSLKTLESAIEAAEQLAIYYEHRAKQPYRAAELIRASIAEFRDAQSVIGVELSRANKIEARLARRLARLERRCATTTAPELLRVL
jgi:hypothetical protein